MIMLNRIIKFVCAFIYKKTGIKPVIINTTSLFKSAFLKKDLSLFYSVVSKVYILL